MTTPPATFRDALDMLQACAGSLAQPSPADLPAEDRADALRVCEQATAMITAAQAAILGVFWRNQDYTADGDGSPRAWLKRETKVSGPGAGWAMGWAKRLGRRPRMAQLMAVGTLPESVAQLVDKWLKMLPDDQQDDAEAALMDKWAEGFDLRELRALFAAILEALGGPEEHQPQDKDRSVTLDTTMDGIGILRGNLTAECAAMLRKMLDSLGGKTGPEDTRTGWQRHHDALQAAASRLLGSGTLPQRAGQPVKAWVHISLADLLLLDGTGQVTAEWIARAHSAWAARRAAAATAEDGTAGDGGAWLTGWRAAAMACDAPLTPVVTGTIDPSVIDELIKLATDLATTDPASRGRASLEQAIIARAVALVSGPDGLASRLRRTVLGARLGGPSLPLDVGYSDNIPVGIRNAVILRDQHCQWSGGCTRPAPHCHVHHTTHKADGGPTSVQDCVLLCPFHHLIAIHQWGWTLTLNPDGTTTAVNPDGTKTLHSHGPPARPG